MKNTFGTSLCVTLFGESHGDTVGATLDGVCPGLPVNEEAVKKALALRRPTGETARREPDDFRFVSGVYRGVTTGTPLTVLIKNTDARPADYEAFSSVARPSHADYTAFVKYHGHADPRGGGHQSGRLTAPLVAVGTVIREALSQKGIEIATHVSRLGGVCDRPFSDYEADFALVKNEAFPVLDKAKKEEMEFVIASAAQNGDSVGGALETAVTGLPAGLGEPWFDSFEGVLSHILFSVPAVKGVSFGDGFSFADERGSEANDSFYAASDRLLTRTNRSGGINGGISNGMPVLFSTVLRPTPSIALPQETADFLKNENTVLSVKGRHDACIASRAAVVINAVTALAVADLYASRFGTDRLGESV